MKEIKMAALNLEPGAAETVAQTSLPTPLPLQPTENVQNERHSSDTRKKNRKYRYKKHGYHKTERENARRVEARNFLSGITLDSHYRTPTETQEQSPSLLHTPSSHSGLVEECKIEIIPADEMANLYDLYNHSPVKLPPSRSQELGFDYSMHHPLVNHPVNRSTSLYEATTPSSELKKLSHLAQAKSFSNDVGGGDIRYFGRHHRFPVDSRYVLKLSL
jgi:hypothetical protein